MNQEVIYEDTPKRKFSYKVLAAGMGVAVLAAYATASLLPQTLTASSATGATTASSNTIATPVTATGKLATPTFSSGDSEND